MKNKIIEIYTVYYSIKFSCNFALFDLSSYSCTLCTHMSIRLLVIAVPMQRQNSTSELQLVVCRRSVCRKDRHCPDVCGSGIRPSGMSSCRACRSALVCDEVARERPAKCCFGMLTACTAAKLIYLLLCLHNVFSNHR